MVSNRLDMQIYFIQLNCDRITTNTFCTKSYIGHYVSNFCLQRAELRPQLQLGLFRFKKLIQTPSSFY